MCSFPPPEKLGNQEVKGTHLESGQLGSNCSFAAYRRRDPGRVLNVADAGGAPLVCTQGSGFPCKLTASGCKNLRGAWGLSPNAGAKAAVVPQGRTKVPRKWRLPGAVFSQRGRESEDKSPSSPALRWDNFQLCSTLSRSSLGGLGGDQPRQHPPIAAASSGALWNHGFSPNTRTLISAQGLIQGGKPTLNCLTLGFVYQ